MRLLKLLLKKFRKNQSAGSFDLSEPTKVAETDGKEMVESRGEWGSQAEFILALLGYSVGLGNVWRFPYLVYQNGGGAFLIPFIIALAIMAIPVFYLEVILGQFSSLGATSVFNNISPIFRGLGWAMVVMSALTSIYYNMVIAWVLFYFFASFRTNLMWEHCRNDWNTPNCFSLRDEDFCKQLLNSSFATYNAGNCTFDRRTLSSNFTINSTTPAFEYYNNYMLEKSDGIDNLGTISWKLVLALLGSWVLVFACLAKGVQSTGKVVYFTATFPYLVIFILLVRGATLDGSLEGIKFYLIPSFEHLANLDVWKEAATQVFYSLGPAFGGLITMASYNKFDNNCYRDTLIVTIGDSFTSIFAGFAVFSILGFMAKENGVPVHEVTKNSGPGLAFIAYPEALTRMPVGPLWSVIFFFMLITLGLDSEFGMVETVTTAVMDEFPKLRRYKTWVVLVCCAVMFLLGLPLCTQGGIYIFTIANEYSAGVCVLVISMTEIIVVIYVYGLNNFLKDVEMMLGTKPNWFWRICWFAVSPAYVMFILITTLISTQEVTVGSYKFPPWATTFGWLITAASIIWIPIFALYAVVKNVFIEKQSWKSLFVATDQYAPAHIRKIRASSRANRTDKF